MEKNIKFSEDEIIIKTSGQLMYEITNNINSWLYEQQIYNGQINIFIAHTSASICIQENASADVLEDIYNFFKKLVPENKALYSHNYEGKDDMPAHIKSMLTQTSLTIPIKNKQLNLGTWQGIFLYEHKTSNNERKLQLTLIGN